MRKELAKRLLQAANETAKIWSDPKREFNARGEKYIVAEIVPLCDTVAAVIYEKNTGKKAVEIFYHVKNRWCHFFPTDSHLLGFRYFEHIKREIEKHNFQFNFNHSNSDEF